TIHPHTSEIYTLSLHDALPIFTSRAEHRLLFNHGSAENRLYQHSKDYNLLSHNRLRLINDKTQAIQRWLEFLENTKAPGGTWGRSEEHTSELQSRVDLVCRLLL